jgi:hypothetical protein
MDVPRNILEALGVPPNILKAPGVPRNILEALGVPPNILEARSGHLIISLVTRNPTNIFPSTSRSRI